MNDRGLTEEGYIKNFILKDNIQPEFKALVEEVIDRLSSQFETVIHSIYLYGSVGRGNAIPGKSDLDISIVTHSPLTEETQTQFNSLADELNAKYSIISKLEFDIGTYQEAMINNDYEWQCWLKHFCTCIWGEDLAEHIAQYRPLTSIGLQMNQDIHQRLEDALNKLVNGGYQETGKSIAKKIIRTAYAFYVEEDNSYYQDLYPIVDLLKVKQPEYSTAIDIAFDLATGTVHSIEEVQLLIEGYGYAVAAEFDKLSLTSKYN